MKQQNPMTLEPVIGNVAEMSGNVSVIESDHRVHALSPHDNLYANSIINTADDASIVIELSNNQSIQLSSNSRILLDDQVVNDQAANPTDESATVEAVQKAIDAGIDPTLITEATGAGQAGESEGHDFVRVDLTGERVAPQSGFETEGLSFAFPATEENPLAGIIGFGSDEQPEIVIPKDVEPEPDLDPDPVIVSITGGSGEEGEAVTFTVTLNKPSAEDVTVTVNVFSSASDTASEGDDYEQGTYTVTIPSGETSVDFSVNTVNDDLVETDETFSAQIVSVISGNAVIDSTTVTGTITDNDIVIPPAPEGVEINSIDLITNTSNSQKHGDESAQQQFKIIITNSGQELMSPIISAEEGREEFSLNFDDGMTLMLGQEYTVTIEYISGQGHINFLSMALFEDEASESGVRNENEAVVVLNTDTASGSGSDNVSVSAEGEFNGIIYGITVTPEGDIHASDPTGYRIEDGDTLVFDSYRNSTDFLVDLSHVSLGDEPQQDLFSVIDRIDMSGGSAESNTLVLGYDEVLELGDGGDHTLTIDGSGGGHSGQDTVHLTGEGWLHTELVDGYAVYVNSDATVRIDESIVVNMNLVA